jgi:hypothetical protein
MALASRRSGFALAQATPRAPRGRFRKFAADNFFPIIRICAIVNRKPVRRRIAGPLIMAEMTKKWEKARFRLDRPTTP